MIFFRSLFCFRFILQVGYGGRSLDHPLEMSGYICPACQPSADCPPPTMKGCGYRFNRPKEPAQRNAVQIIVVLGRHHWLYFQGLIQQNSKLPIFNSISQENMMPVSLCVLISLHKQLLSSLAFSAKAVCMWDVATLSSYTFCEKKWPESTKHLGSAPGVGKASTVWLLS